MIKYYQLTTKWWIDNDFESHKYAIYDTESYELCYYKECGQYISREYVCLERSKLYELGAFTEISHDPRSEFLYNIDDFITKSIDG